MTITDRRRLYPDVIGPDLDEAWALYEDVFRGIDELAAQRHLMTYAEFTAVCRDDNIRKFYAFDDGYLIGMSVLTQHLEAWPLISPRFFARRWPEHYVRHAIWYVGFVGVRPRHVHAFAQLINAMYPHVVGNRGVVVMDVCAHNVVRRLPEITHKLLGRINPTAAINHLDTQTFVAFHFDEGAS